MSRMGILSVTKAVARTFISKKLAWTREMVRQADRKRSLTGQRSR